MITKEQGLQAVRDGIAGEFRVLSELLLRGIPAAKSYTGTGVDIILENGKKIQVKSSHKMRASKTSLTEKYYFTLSSYTYSKTRNRKRSISESVDFVIGFGIDDQRFYIIPRNKIKGKTALSVTLKPQRKNKYAKYLNAWRLLI